MACELKAWLVFAISLLALDCFQPWVCGAPQVPCYFIYGDSLADPGNNNLLVTQAKANYQPYGIDLQNVPKGRFSNARTTVDIIAELLGFPAFIPPFVSVRGNDVLQGVNYASGAAGIRDESGQTQGARFSFNAQLQNHQFTVSRIIQILGSNDSATEYLSRCLYSVGFGSNDYINNYFMPQDYPTSRQYTPDQYAQVLIGQYYQQLKTLYKLGARKVAVFGLGQLGCTPAELAMYGATNGSSCVDSINDAVQLFNNRLRPLVDDLNRNLKDAKFSFLNGTSDANAVAALGFKVTNAPCCEIGSNIFQCRPFGTVCPNRTEYIFWDNIHLTEEVNVLQGRKYYKAPSLNDAYPYGIQQLAQL